MREDELEFFAMWLRLESRGHTVCHAAAETVSDPSVKAKWALMAKVEHATMSAIQRHLPPSAINAADHIQLKEFSVRPGPDREAFIETFASGLPRIKGYCDEMRDFAENASPGTTAMLAQRLYEHEVAIMEFVELELQGQEANSTAPILAHLSKWEGGTV